MTVEELKAEAKKHGYRIVPVEEPVKLLPCFCGRKRLELWWDSEEKASFYKCPNCNLRSPSAKTKKEARKKWNNMIEKKKERKDKGLQKKKL